jgi:hypothetical protein
MCRGREERKNQRKNRKQEKENPPPKKKPNWIVCFEKILALFVLVSFELPKI